MARQSAEMQGQSDRLNPVVVETRRGPEQLIRILEALARLELSDGLTLSQLIVEATSRLPRDATVVALLPQAPPETAIALGGLKRRGYSVVAMLVLPDEDELKEHSGRLVAEGIEVRVIENEDDISHVCSLQV